MDVKLALEGGGAHHGVDAVSQLSSHPRVLHLNSDSQLGVHAEKSWFLLLLSRFFFFFCQQLVKICYELLYWCVSALHFLEVTCQSHTPHHRGGPTHPLVKKVLTFWKLRTQWLSLFVLMTQFLSCLFHTNCTAGNISARRVWALFQGENDLMAFSSFLCVFKQPKQRVLIKISHRYFVMRHF